MSSARYFGTIGKRLTAGLIEDLKTFGFVAGLFIALMSIPALQHYEDWARADAIERELASLPGSNAGSGRRARIEGRIASDTRPLLGKLVIYVEQTYRAGGKSRTSFWETTGGRSQAIRIVTPTGSTWLARIALQHAYQPTPLFGGSSLGPVAALDHAEGRQQSTQGVERVRQFGFLAGGPVTAIGIVRENGVFDAEYFLGGTPDAVRGALADIKSGRAADPVYYWCLVIGQVGLALTLLGFFGVRLRAFVRSADLPAHASP